MMPWVDHKPLNVMHVSKRPTKMLRKCMKSYFRMGGLEIMVYVPF